MFAHVTHPVREFGQRPGEGPVLHVPQNLMPVLHRLDVVQRGTEKRCQVIFVPRGRHRGEHLIEVQVDEYRRIRACRVIRGPLEQDAPERRRRSGQGRLHQHVVPQKPSAIPAVQASFITLSRMYLVIMTS